MTRQSNDLIIFDDVSKFYGEILGVNRVNLAIAPGITSLVGPNGAGKSTVMNLMTGLLRPTRGTISLLGIPTDRPDELFRKVGYCTQFDSFPRGVTGREFINSFLLVHGYDRKKANELTDVALNRVNLLDAGDRKVAAYSKGMRQRIRLAQSIAHQPVIMILDEPLNGLDPMVRAETIALFRKLASNGLHLIISSHILHEVDMMSDRVVLLNNGYVVAEGNIHGVRDEMQEHPMQILIRCDEPSKLAAHEDGAPFDSQGKGTSDLDVTLVGNKVMSEWASDAYYIPGLHTKPLCDSDPDIAPSLNPLRESLQKLVGRPVNFQATSSLVLYTRDVLLGEPYFVVISTGQGA